MEIIGIVLILVGGILFWVQRNQKNRAFSIRTAKSATVAELQQMSKAIAHEIGGGNWRDYVKLSGTIECDRPLTSELKQEPCAFYKMEVRREYEETVTRTDDEGKTHRETRRSSETVSSHQQSTPFHLNDQSGTVVIHPDGADIETVKILDDFRPDQGIGGMISYGTFSRAVGSVAQGDRRTLGYRYSESILPLRRRALIVGTISDASGDLILQKPLTGDQKFIISLKSEEELLKSADQSAQYLFYAMLACLGIGAIVLLIGLVS